MWYLPVDKETSKRLIELNRTKRSKTKFTMSKKTKGILWALFGFYMLAATAYTTFKIGKWILMLLF